MTHGEPNTNELFTKHGEALREFLLNQNSGTTAALYDTHTGLAKRETDMKGDELVVFLKRYMNQVIRVHAEVGRQKGLLAAPGAQQVRGI
jgi:hypothetical protein